MLSITPYNGLSIITIKSTSHSVKTRSDTLCCSLHCRPSQNLTNKYVGSLYTGRTMETHDSFLRAVRLEASSGPLRSEDHRIRMRRNGVASYEICTTPIGVHEGVQYDMRYNCHRISYMLTVGMTAKFSRQSLPLSMIDLEGVFYLC